MELYDINNTRHYIVHQYARWCAFSSTRSGCPLKARRDVYPLIDTPDYGKILSKGVVMEEEAFLSWHEAQTLEIEQKSAGKLGVGWATKLVNVYLKTMVYVAKIGHPSLLALIHPPIDGGLWEGVKQRYLGREAILSKTHMVEKIKDIKSYEQYQTIISGISLIAKTENWMMIEVEQLWTGTNFKQ
jgi:hypothetical protein